MFIHQNAIKLKRLKEWKKRFKNIPNILAFIRVVMAFLMYLFIVNRDIFSIHPSWLDYFAALIFVLASITDFLTDILPEILMQQVSLGKF